MRYKDIDAIEVFKMRKKGKILRVLSETPSDLIILDAFTDKVYLGRYAINVLTGEYACKKKDTWHNQKLEIFLGETGRQYYYMPDIRGWKFETDIQHELISSMLDPKAEEGYKEDFNRIFYKIDGMEREFGREKRSRAYDSKCRKIEELMNKIPDIPNDFVSWWLHTAEGVKDEEYMFLNKITGEYGCTACGGTHSIHTKVKHRQDYICRRTGRRATIIKRQQSIENRDYAMMISSVDENWSAERLFKITTVWCGKKKNVYVEEAIRAMLSKKGKKTKIYYSQSHENSSYWTSNMDWWDSNLFNKRWNNAYLYPPKKEARIGTQIENLHIESMAAVGAKLNWNGLIYYGELVGCFEYLLKMGLKRLALEESEKLDIWGGYYSLRDGIHTNLNLEGSSAEEILGMNKQRINRLRDVNGGSITLEWLQIEEMTGKKISGEALEKAERWGLKAREYQFIFDRMNPEQVINYIIRQKESGLMKWNVVDYWKDYLAMAIRLGMDTKDEIVYKPKNLKQRHDELIEEIRKLGDNEWICNIASKYPNVDRICKEIKEKYEFETDEYKMIVPDGIRDIVDDGNQLNHCSASCERYFDRINKKECYLLFLRKKEDLSKAWYTVEIQPDGTVRQKRTEYNRQDDVDKVMQFIKQWQQAIKKRLTQEDLELGRQSEIQREIEQMELLQKGDEKSLRVWQELENDYLEVV